MTYRRPSSPQLRRASDLSVGHGNIAQLDLNQLFVSEPVGSPSRAEMLDQFRTDDRIRETVPATRHAVSALASRC